MKPRSYVELAMVHWRIVLTLCAAMFAFGLFSFLHMPRQEFPDFTIRQGLVVAVMPGATSREIEERVARPVEDYLFSFKEVRKSKTYSVSSDGQLVVFVELGDEVHGEAAPAFWAKLRHGLNELKAQKLPPQVVALVGNNDFGDTSALLFTVSADGRSPRDIQKYLEVLEAHLRRIEATSKLRTYGAQEEVIRVSLSRERLSRYGVGPTTVWASLQGLGMAPAPARLDTDELEMPIHVTRVLRSEAELGDTLLLNLPTGAQVRLKDVATLTREYGHDDSFVRFNGKTALVLSIEMQSGHDITQFGKDVDAALAEIRRELPPGVQITRVADQPHVVDEKVGHFLRDFGIAVVAVIAVTVLLLPLRVAAVAAISIPVCIVVTLGVMNALGVQLQTVSLAGLVVVLGMVVDNAIVIIDDHVDKLDRGKDPWTAAWMSARELTIPVLTATVAIIATYVPIPLLVPGMAGDFLGSLPVTIGVALTVSLLTAVLLVPIMNSQFIRRGLHQRADRRSILDRVQGRFDAALDRAFRHPVLTLLIGVGSVVGALALMRAVPQQSFPKVERNQFAVEVYLPSGRTLARTDAVIRRLETELLADKRVTNVTAFIGQSSPRFHSVYAPNMPSRRFGQLLVNTVSEDATLAVLRDDERRLSGSFPDAWIRWKQLDMQKGSPVEVRISGDDIGTLRQVAAEIETYARTIPGTTWVRDDYEDPLQVVDVVPDTDACARLGVPPALLQTSLAMASQGVTVGTVWEDDYPVRVLVKDEPWSATHVEGLRQQYVTSMLAGASVPLEQLASLRPAWTEGAIVRRNGVRTMTVSVDLGMDALGSVVQQRIEAFVDRMDRRGARVDYGGEKEMATEVFVPMTFSMVVSIALIFVVLLFQFQRFRKVALVMLAMPLSLPGAVLGLVVARYPFGVTAFIGIIGLLGIVVRNGVILVTYAEDLRRDHGMSAREAGLAAGKRRMRPICLTSVAAAVGVVPMILSRSLLWGPLGTVTCFGLLVAMVLTLFVLPVAYAVVIRDEHKSGASAAPTSGIAAVVALLVVLLGPTMAHAQSGPLSLAQARALALANNSQIQQATLEVEAAQETRDATYTKYFPSVSAAATGFLAVDPLAQIASPGGNLPVYDGKAANLSKATEYAYMPPSTMSMAGRGAVFSLSAVQPVYAGDRITNGNRLAELGVQVARDKATLSRRDVLAQTEEKYWQLVVLAEKQRTLEAYETLLGRLDREVSDAVQSGLLTRNDQLKVRLKRSGAKVDRLRLESGLRLAARDLRRHLGLPEGDSLALADGLDAPEDPGALVGQREGATDRRPELRLLASAVRAEHLQTELKRGEMLPTVSVGGAVLRTDISGMEGSTNALVFGMVSVPLSDVWEGVHATASQRKRERIAEKRLVDTRQLVELEIEKTWSDLEASWSAARVSDEAVEQSEVNLKEESDRQTSGLVAFSDVLEAQVLRQQALNRRVDARGEYWLKRSAFLRAVSREDATSPPGGAQ